MPHVKIICLAHPAEWSNISHNIDNIYRKILRLNSSHQSWLNLNDKRGGRTGIYKVERMKKERCVSLRFIAEGDINEEYPSVEKILEEEDSLPDGVEVPTPIPSASKSLLFLDLNEGICYIYSPGKPSKINKYLDVLTKLEKDTGLPVKDARIFEWKENAINIITEEARRKGFQPYKVKMDLENVDLTAEGDLENNENWRRIEESIDTKKWKNIVYVKSSVKEMFVFGLTRYRRKQIFMPWIEINYSLDNIFEKILKTRDIIEKALGNEIRQYCFPEQLLTKFLRQDSIR